MTGGDIRIGTVFFGPDEPGGADGHLRVVISPPLGDPPQVLTVSVTTWTDRQDQSCILEPVDHPSVRHRSVIGYGFARLDPADGLRKQLRQGTISPRAPASTHLIERIWEGAERTRQLTERCRRHLVESGILP